MTPATFFTLLAVSILLALLAGILGDWSVKCGLPNWRVFRHVRMVRIAGKCMQPGVLLVSIFYLGALTTISLLQGAQIFGVVGLIICLCILLCLDTHCGVVSRALLKKRVDGVSRQCVRCTVGLLIATTILGRGLLWVLLDR